MTIGKKWFIWVSIKVHLLNWSTKAISLICSIQITETLGKQMQQVALFTVKLHHRLIDAATESLKVQMSKGHACASVCTPAPLLQEQARDNLQHCTHGWFWLQAVTVPVKLKPHHSFVLSKFRSTSMGAGPAAAPLQCDLLLCGVKRSAAVDLHDWLLVVLTGGF